MAYHVVWWVGLYSIIFLILIGGLSISSASAQISHPIWINNIGTWWSTGKISDKEFVDSYTYLIDNKVITVQGSSYGQSVSFADKLQETKILANYISQGSHITTNSEITKPITYLIEQPQLDTVQDNTGFRNLPPSGIHNYFIYVVPSIGLLDNPDILLSDATSYWQQITNVNFKFVSEPEDASVIIRWIKESDGPYSAYTVSNSLIEVGLGDSRCNGVWHQYNSDFTTSLLKHELGHVLGYKHSNDPTNIMYPLIHNAKYAPIEETLTLSPNQPIFVSVCSFNDISSVHYKIAGDANNQFTAFFVDSEKQYAQALRGQQFSYYQQDGCHASNTNNYEGMCKNVSADSGLILEPDKYSSSVQKVTVLMEELQ